MKGVLIDEYTQEICTRSSLPFHSAYSERHFVRMPMKSTGEMGQIDPTWVKQTETRNSVGFHENEARGDLLDQTSSWRALQSLARHGGRSHAPREYRRWTARRCHGGNTSGRHGVRRWRRRLSDTQDCLVVPTARPTAARRRLRRRSAVRRSAAPTAASFAPDPTAGTSPRGAAGRPIRPRTQGSQGLIRRRRLINDGGRT